MGFVFSLPVKNFGFRLAHFRVSLSGFRFPDFVFRLARVTWLRGCVLCVSVLDFVLRPWRVSDFEILMLGWLSVAMSQCNVL